MAQRVLIGVLLGGLLGGCVQSRPPFDMAGLSPEQLKTAGSKAETPARISTVEFKELGDTRRGQLVAQFIRATWDEPCDPAMMRLNGYARNGASQWDVVCKGSALAKDYIVAIPEHAKDNARVLKCYRIDRQWSSCSIVGSPADAATRTADLSLSETSTPAAPPREDRS